MPPLTRQLIAQIKSMVRGYAHILKYDRNQPRNPKGSGREGGRWTKGGASQGLHGEDAPSAHGLTTAPGMGKRRTTPPGTGRRSYNEQRGAGFGTMEKARGGSQTTSSGWSNGGSGSGSSGTSSTPPVSTAFTDVLLNVPKGGKGYANRPRITGDPEMVARLKPQTPTEQPVVERLRTAVIVSHKPLEPGEHANDAFKVKLADGSIAVAKPNRGEYLPREDGDRRFGNGDIDRCLTNKALSLGEREAMAFEFSEAAKLNFTPTTVYRENVEGMPESSKNPRAPKNGGMLQEFVEGLNEGDTDATPEEIRKMAIFNYAVGSMDHHGDNVFYSKDGKLLAMDNGYSFPDPGVAGSGGGGKNLRLEYDEYQVEAEQKGQEYADKEMQKLWETHVDKAEKRAKEIKEVWDDLTGEHEKTIGAAVAGQAHPVLPMGSKPPFHRKEAVEIDMNDVLKEAKVDIDGGPLDKDEKERVREILSQRIAEGATALSGFSKTGFREDERTAWFEDHADEEAEFRDENPPKSFTEWKEYKGYGPGSDPADKGQSEPNGEPDGFQFRANMTDNWRNGDEDDHKMPEAERKPIREALEATDWKAFVDRHPNMSPGERKAFLGRIDRLKEALKTEDGLHRLWQRQNIP